ncbi:unnamed protein product [Amaranthus hypochondriacus]
MIKIMSKFCVGNGFGLFMGMLVISLFLLILPQILPSNLPPPPSLLLFVPVVIMVVLLHLAFCSSPQAPVTVDAASLEF